MTYDLEKIEEVCRAATPGPWIIKQEEIVGSCIVDANDDYAIEMDIPENDNLVIIARTALPELCARVRELEEQLREYQIDECRLCGEFSFVEHIKELEEHVSYWKTEHASIECQMHEYNQFGKQYVDEMETLVKNYITENAALRKVAAAAQVVLEVWDKHRDIHVLDADYKLKYALTAAQRPTDCGPGEGKEG